MAKIYAVETGEGESYPEEWDFKDITEAVQALYDLAVSSLDYGSGFWSYEDAAPVARLAKLMGWEGAEGLQKYCDDKLHRTEADAWMADNGHSLYWCRSCAYISVPYEKHSADGSICHGNKIVLAPHEHVFSTPGRCMLHDCPETEKRE